MKTFKLLPIVIGFSLSFATAAAMANGAGVTQCPQPATSVFNFQTAATNANLGTITSTGVFNGHVTQLVSSPLSSQADMPRPAGMQSQNGVIPSQANLKLVSGYDGSCQYTYKTATAWHGRTLVPLTLHFV